MTLARIKRYLPAILPIGMAAFPLLLMADPLEPGATPPDGVLAALGFGFVLGLKHALDADHLVAVSAIVSERKSAWSAAVVGTMWGLGHTASLLLAGVLVIGLRVQLPPEAAPFLEFLVAVMIVGLGINLLVKIIRHGGATLHAHTHSHGDRSHWHPHLHYGDGAGENVREHHWIRSGRKPFLVGMMHGLAGSATLVLLVLTEIPSAALGILYLGIFGLGSVGGMLLMSTLFALPFNAISARFSRLDLGLRLSAGLLSIVFGIYMMTR